MSAESTDPAASAAELPWAVAWPEFVAGKMKPYSIRAVAQLKEMLAARGGRGLLGAGPDEAPTEDAQ